VSPTAVIGDPHDEIENYIKHRKFTPDTMLALRQIVNDVGNEMESYATLADAPDNLVRNFRNDMYLTSEALRLMKKSGQPAITAHNWKELDNYKAHIDKATKFIPPWVKVAVAIALGLGTMIGWKRIVVTVGEKIGKQHLTYSQGAAAEITAAATIGAADYLGLPVSTTHVLSSGIAGTMAANQSGLQLETIRNIALTWVLTLPAAVMLAAFLYYVFRSAF
jgi:PiT family inorganic phosphate transporter